jgi:sterol desaturase/sphingolipid hydroxylase (fatty acid hydroxylase superfamily)
MQLFDNWVATASAIVGQMAPLLALLWALERLASDVRVSAESQFRSLKFWGIHTAATALVMVYVKLWQDAFQVQPLVVLPLTDWFSHPSMSWLAYLICPLMAFMIYDFFQYWMHRAQHKFFWKQHAVHHSIDELSGINSYFHWTEELFRAVFITIPLSVLIGLDAVPTFIIITILNNMHGYYLHSPTKLHFGRTARRVLADNRYHRIHHSRESVHFDKNFGAFASIWDQVFGTAYFPRTDEWPETGVPDQPSRGPSQTIFGSHSGGPSSDQARPMSL